MENKSCIFCEIVARKKPSFKVYEDNEFLGILDTIPRAIGHTLLLPKKHYRWVYDVANFGEYWQKALKVTRAIQKAFKPAFISYVTLGRVVSHAHIHIIPYESETSGESFFPSVKNLEDYHMEEIARRIKKEL